MFTARQETFPGDGNHDVHKMTHSAESEDLGSMVNPLVIYRWGELSLSSAQAGITLVLYCYSGEGGFSLQSWGVLGMIYTNSIMLEF
jgi:hypothetical protein